MERYIRQTCLLEVGSSGQQKLEDAKILCIGAGGLGSNILPSIVGAGVGQLTIVDFDEVALHNLHRQTLFEESHIGQNKAKCAKLRLNKLNQDVKIHAIDQALSEDNGKELFLQHDLILDACDNFDTKFFISDLAKQTQKPYCYASVRRFEGQVALLNPTKGYAIESFMTKPTEAQQVREYHHGVLPSMVAWIGAMAAQISLGYCLGGSLAPKLGQLIIVDGKAFQLQKLQLPIISL